MPHSYRSLTTTVTTLPVKDALRTLRHTLLRGRTALEAPLDPLPSPLGSVARGVLSDVDSLAGRVSGVAESLTEHFLDSRWRSLPQAATLEDIQHTDEPDIAFAQAAYRVLTRAMHYLGGVEALVSEMRAAEAYRAAERSPLARQDRFGFSAALVAELRRRRVVASVVAAAGGQRGDRTDPSVVDVAVFALALWLLTDRDDDGDWEAAESLLQTCCDIAWALRVDVAQRLASPERLRDLLAAYVDKV